MEGSGKMKMAEETEKKLKEGLLLQILARLPMKSIMRFRAVCKRWNEIFSSLEFRRLVSTLEVSTTPAFLLVQAMQSSNLLRNLWISTESSYKFHSLSLDFLPSPVISVVTGCKSLLCCSGIHGFYICNPVTKTWIELPALPPIHGRLDFVCLAFDLCTTCCTLIMGRNYTVDNDTEVEMYDSKTNKWTPLEIPAGNVIRPRGEGVYSNGKFHWLNDVHDGQRFSLVTFDGDQGQWNTIEGPLSFHARLLLSRGMPVQHVAQVSGCEEHIVVACDDIWTLNANEEGEGEKWSTTFDSVCNPITREFAVNESGCCLAFDMLASNVVVKSHEGELLQGIGFEEVADVSLSQYKKSSISVRAFQVNNIWWP